MTKGVKASRPYNSVRRRQQAEQTRHDIVVAAGQLFRERGYGVALTEVASAAGVVVETIYRIFGSKAGLFRACIEALLAGGVARGDSPVEERAAIKAVIEEPDPRRQLELWTATQPGLHRRAGAVLRSLHAAAATDPELRKLWDEMEAWRLQGQGRIVSRLAAAGALRPDRSEERATDIVFAMTSLAVHDVLVIDRGWSYEDYLRWLTALLTHELLGDGAPNPGERAG